MVRVGPTATGSARRFETNPPKRTVFGTEKVLASACMMGQKVRYDASDVEADALLERWREEGGLVDSCPELAGASRCRVPRRR